LPGYKTPPCILARIALRSPGPPGPALPARWLALRLIRPLDDVYTEEPFPPNLVGGHCRTCRYRSLRPVSRSSGVPTPLRYRGTVLGKKRDRPFQHTVMTRQPAHQRNSSNGDSRKIQDLRFSGAFFSAPGETRPAIQTAPAVVSPFGRSLCSPRPNDEFSPWRPGQRLATWKQRALIKTYHNVRPQRSLGSVTDSGLRKVFAPIQVGSEINPFLLHFSQSGQAENLKSLHCRQDRSPTISLKPL